MILSGRELHKAYGSVNALNGVSINCEPGEIYGVLGANGARKNYVVQNFTRTNKTRFGRCNLL